MGAAVSLVVVGAMGAASLVGEVVGTGCCLLLLLLLDVVVTVWHG
jgi:hypothetical protein